MSNQNFANLVSNKRNFTVAQKGKLFTSPSYTENEDTPYEEAALGAGVLVDDTSITVTGGFPVDLYEGTRIVFATDFTLTPDGEGYFIVSEFVPATTAAIPIEKTSVAAASGDFVRIKAYIPIFSAKTFQLDDQSNVISDNVFSDGLYSEKAVTTINATSQSSGAWIYDDPGLEVLEEAKSNAKRVYIEYIFPFLRGGRGFEAYASQISISANREEFVQVSNQYEVTGEPVKIAALV